MIEQARNFAITSHKDQKYGSHPYSYQLDAVAKLVRPFGETTEVIAYLHDVVEDTTITIEQIELQFGKLVANAVAILTDESGANRKERKAKTYVKMANVVGDSEIALTVKAADRLANMRACVLENNVRLLAVYNSEYPVFRKSVFRPDACDEIWSELETLFNA